MYWVNTQVTDLPSYGGMRPPNGWAAIATTSETFVPVVVLLSADGVELSESYGAPQRLQAGETLSLTLAVKAQGVAPGQYFLAVIATHPKTGKRLGTGRHHIPLRLRG